MNRRIAFSVLFLGIYFLLSGVTANTVVTNDVTISGSFPSMSTNVTLTVAPYYGFGPVHTVSSVYSSPPNYVLKIPVTITNAANDADSNAQVFVEFLSNENGYSGTNWSCYIELAGTNAGTNYGIPLSDFGEGAVFSFNLAVVVPADLGTNTNIRGFVNVFAITSSNAGHPVALYTGLNGLSYGGESNVAKTVEVDISAPNAVRDLAASDGIDTITIFDGTRGLRRTEQAITVGFLAAPSDYNSAYLWFDVDNTADGPGGANANDKVLKMQSTGGYTFRGVIGDSWLSSGNNVSFVIYLDNFAYAFGSLYSLLTLASQDKYETVLMHNVIARNSGELIYIKVPSKVIGTSGKIQVYSVSGDLVMTILSGNLDRQIVSWDGNDKDGKQVAKGLYFLVFEFNNLKEVRKCFIK